MFFSRCIVSGLVLAISLAARGAETPLVFTVTCDPRGNDDVFREVLSAVRDRAGGMGAFHVTVGDVDPPAPLRAVVDDLFGRDAVWYPGVGNHDTETPDNMAWLRAEFRTGNGARTPLMRRVTRRGPLGTDATTYSWDQGPAHFVMLNVYWDGDTSEHADESLMMGTVMPPLRQWLAADLAASTQAVSFVFTHEPAFPQHRHIGDSLDHDAASRDAFWQVLETNRVAALIAGHTHVYSRYRPEGSRVWQADVGNAGRDPIDDGQTFLRVTVTVTNVLYDVWRGAGETFRRAARWQEAVPRPRPSP